MELSKATLCHFLDLRQHRSTLLEGVSSIAFRHINHLMSAMSRLGLNVLTDDQSAERVLDLIYEEQGLSTDRNSRPMVEFINMIPWEMYLCLLYVELEGYRSASSRDPTLAFGPLEELLGQKAAMVEDLKTLRDKVLHPAKSIDLRDALDRFMDSGALVDGHYYKAVFDLQRRLDMYVLWLGSSLAQLGIGELTEASRSGRRIKPGRLDLLRRARVAAAAPPVFNGTFDLSARQTPFDMWKWMVLGLYREIRLEKTSGTHPDFLRRAKTDGMRMLMRSLVFANECVHLLDFEKLRSIKTRAELDAQPPPQLLLQGVPAGTEQEIQNLAAPWRVSCALLVEPLRLYYQTVEVMPNLRREAIDEAAGTAGVPTELARFRNLVFHLGGNGDDPNDTEDQLNERIRGGASPLDLLPLLLDFFMSV